MSDMERYDLFLPGAGAILGTGVRGGLGKSIWLRNMTTLPDYALDTPVCTEKSYRKITSRYCENHRQFRCK